MIPQLFPAAAVLGDYRLEGLLGTGGQGHVHRARHGPTGLACALKVLRDPGVLPQLERARGVEHPSLVRVLELGRSQGLAYVAMELLEGPTLREVLSRRGALATPVAVSILLPVLAALQAAHEAGLVHGDLRPENVVLEQEDAGGPVVKLLDLGGVLPAEGGDAVVGSDGYLSPEQAAGEAIDARSDVFGAGVLLHELVTGLPPFAAAGPVATAYRIIHRPAPRLADVHLAPILEVALAKAPADRFATAALFARALADRG